MSRCGDIKFALPDYDHQLKPDIKTASNTVGIDLEKPINLSEMVVQECSYIPKETYHGMKFHLKTELKGYDINKDTGETDEIFVTIVRISSKRPKKS